MEDRGADVLAERTAIESGAFAAIILSLGAHASVGALAVWVAWHHPTTVIPAVMNIRFAQMRGASPAPAASTVIATTNRAAVSKVLAPPKPIAKPVAASPFGKSPKKATEAKPAAPAVAPVTATQPDIAIGGAGVTGLEGGDFPYTIYIDRMKTLIGSRWLRPAVGSGATTTVYFVIDRDGTLRDAKTETFSGNGAFDRGALRAVLESSPLPPLPFGYSGTYLGVHLTFR